MEDRRFIKAAEGRLVRNPDAGNRELRQTGECVPWNSYWARRLADGDVEFTTEEAVLAAEAAAEKAAAAEKRAAAKASSQGEGN